jgi:hypothetical protein
MPPVLATLLTAVVSLLLHLTLGWPWTLVAGMVGGFLANRHNGLVGMAGVGVAWLGLVGWNYAVAPGPVAEMTRVMGALFGNLPGAVVVGGTLLIGLLLGLLGGRIGGQVKALLPTRKPELQSP